MNIQDIGMKCIINILDIKEDLKTQTNVYFRIKYECTKLGNIIEKHNGETRIYTRS
jgi:hypothetical protein